MGGQRNQRYPFNRGGSGGKPDKSSIVEHVISYDLPSTTSSRTARIGNTGKQCAVGSTSCGSAGLFKVPTLVAPCRDDPDRQDQQHAQAVDPALRRFPSAHPLLLPPR
jgi:hypothetical protein